MAKKFKKGERICPTCKKTFGVKDVDQECPVCEDSPVDPRIVGEEVESK